MKTKFATLVNCGNEVYEFSKKITEAAALIVADVNSQSNLITESIAKSEIELVLSGEKVVRGTSRKFIAENINFIRDAIKSLDTASVGRRGDKFQLSASNVEPEMFDDQRGAELSLLKHLSQKASLMPGSKITVIIDGDAMDNDQAMNVIRGKYYGDGKPTISSKEMFGDDDGGVESIPTDRTGADSKDPLSLIPIKDKAAAYMGKQLLNDKLITEGDESEEPEDDSEKDESKESKPKETKDDEPTAIDMLNAIAALPKEALTQLSEIARDLIQSSKVAFADAYTVVSAKIRELTGSVENAFRELVKANVEALLGDAKTEDNESDVNSERGQINLLGMIMASKEIVAHADKFQTGEGKELVAAATKAKESIDGTDLEGVIGEVDGEDVNMSMDDPVDDASQVAELPTDGTQPIDSVDLGLPGDTAMPGATDLPDADDIMADSFGIESDSDDEGESEEDPDDDDDETNDKKD